MKCIPSSTYPFNNSAQNALCYFHAGHDKILSVSDLSDEEMQYYSRTQALQLTHTFHFHLSVAHCFRPIRHFEGKTANIVLNHTLLEFVVSMELSSLANLLSPSTSIFFVSPIQNALAAVKR